jgi:hypothetical protein
VLVYSVLYVSRCVMADLLGWDSVTVTEIVNIRLSIS